MAIIDVTYTKVNPEQPSSVPGQQVNLYAPYASAEVAGLIKYDGSIFELNDSRQLTLSGEWLDVTFTAKSPNNLENVAEGSVQTKNADNQYNEDYGIAIGKGLISTNSAYLYGLIGRYNEDTNERGDAYFVVGDGTSDTERHNIFEVTSDGAYHNHNKLVAIVNDKIQVPNIETNGLNAAEIKTDSARVNGNITALSLNVSEQSTLNMVNAQILQAADGRINTLASQILVTENFTTNGDAMIGGGLTVRGPLTLQGQGTTVDFDTVESKNNIIVTNSNATPIGGLYTGIVSLHGQNEGDGNAIAVALYNPTADAVQIGFGTYNADNTFESEELRTVAIRTDSAAWTAGDIAIWDNTIYGFKSSGKKVTDFLTSEDVFQEFTKDTVEQDTVTTQKIDLSHGQLSLLQESTTQGNTIVDYSFVAKQNKIELVSQGVSLFKYASGEHESTIDMSSTSGAGKIHIDTESVKLTQYGRNKILKFPSNTELTGDITYTLPKKSGTVALLDDIPEGGGSGIVTSVNGDSSTETGIYAPTKHGSIGARLVAQGEGNAPIWDTSNRIYYCTDSGQQRTINVGTNNDALYNGKIIRVVFSILYRDNSYLYIRLNSGEYHAVRVAYDGDSGGQYLVASNAWRYQEILTLMYYNTSWYLIGRNYAPKGTSITQGYDVVVGAYNDNYEYTSIKPWYFLVGAWNSGGELAINNLSRSFLTGLAFLVQTPSIAYSYDSQIRISSTNHGSMSLYWPGDVAITKDNMWTPGDIIHIYIYNSKAYVLQTSSDISKARNALTTIAQTLTAAQQQQVLTNLGLVNVAVNGQ